MEFGKNRVQYDNFNWTYYNYGSYKVYFYNGGENIAAYVGEKAKEYINQMSSFLQYDLSRQIELVVYTKQSEYAQSNLGLNDGAQYNIGGLNHIVGGKIVLYFEGDHRKLDEQIRMGIAQVIFNQMMYGGTLTNIVRGSALLNIPPWFEQGFIYYMAYGWNTDIDNRVRDGILTGRYRKFNHLIGMDATYAGLSVWHYIDQTYGRSIIPNLLYLTRTSRSVENAFLFVLGTSIKSLTSDWYNYYTTQYKKDYMTENLPKEQPVIKPKKDRIYYHMKTSPDGRYVVYSTNQLGQDKVWLYDMQTKKRRRILKQGHKIDRIIDLSYPLVAWHPSGELFSLIMEKEGKIMLYTYTLATHKLQSRRIVNFQKILSFSYSDNGTKFVMSAVQKGQSDIFVFTAASNGYEQITDDIYDDMSPRFIDHSRKIIFSSNRPDDSLRNGGDFHNMQQHYDIFEYNYATHSNVLRRITNTPDVDETNPMGFSRNYIAYLSNATGIANRYVAYIDSTISFVDTAAHYRYIIHSYPVTDYTRNILEQDASPSLKNYTQVILYKGRYRMYQDTLPAIPTATLPTLPRSTGYMSRFLAAQNQKWRNDSIAKHTKKDSLTISIKLPAVVKAKNIRKNTPTDTLPKLSKADTNKTHVANTLININEYSFASDKNNTQDTTSATNLVPTLNVIQQPKQPAAADTVKTAKTVKDTTKIAKIPPQRENYHVSFSSDYVLTQLSTSFLNQSYQVYVPGASPLYQNPGLDAFIKVGLTDLFEDYRIDGGVRLSGDFSNNEYYLSYSDYSKRLDKQLILHRAANTYSYNNTGYSQKVYTHDATYIIKWPFSEVARIEASAGVRVDKAVVRSSDLTSLETPNQITTTPNAELAYVYDATLPVETNIRYGLRAKAFAQYYRDIKGKNNMYVVGLDVRYYQKISRDLIWANRFAAGSSFGGEKLLYYLGGVDNWFSPKFYDSIAVPQNENFAYQTLATPMRGFYQNVRNGNSFALINSEIRFPIFHYLINHPIKSDFINSFQLIAFGDAGTAWTGISPYSNKNALNTTVIGAPGNPVTIILYTQQNPIVEGIGGGVRSRLLGYFIRFDEAWGISDGVIAKKPISYLSLSLDF